MVSCTWPWLWRMLFSLGLAIELTHCGILLELSCHLVWLLASSQWLIAQCDYFLKCLYGPYRGSLHNYLAQSDALGRPRVISLNSVLPGLIYRMVKPKIVLLIFVSGKVVLTGAKIRQEIYEAFDNIHPILKNFKNSASTSTRCLKSKEVFKWCTELFSAAREPSSSWGRDSFRGRLFYEASNLRRCNDDKSISRLFNQGFARLSYKSNPTVEVWIRLLSKSKCFLQINALLV